MKEVVSRGGVRSGWKEGRVEGTSVEGKEVESKREREKEVKRDRQEGENWKGAVGRGKDE